MYNIAIDIGGTFTDVVVIENESGQLYMGKSLTTPYRRSPMSAGLQTRHLMAIPLHTPATGFQCLQVLSSRLERRLLPVRLPTPLTLLPVMQQTRPHPPLTLCW